MPYLNKPKSSKVTIILKQLFIYNENIFKNIQFLKFSIDLPDFEFCFNNTFAKSIQITKLNLYFHCQTISHLSSIRLPTFTSLNLRRTNNKKMKSINLLKRFYIVKYCRKEEDQLSEI